MDLEKTVTKLQTQNSQFQEALLTLAKGQQDMMALLAAKKKPKKKALLNMGSVVPQNFPSHISQYISSEFFKLLKEVQGLTRQTLS